MKAHIASVLVNSRTFTISRRRKANDVAEGSQWPCDECTLSLGRLPTSSSFSVLRGSFVKAFLVTKIQAGFRLKFMVTRRCTSRETYGICGSLLTLFSVPLISAMCPAGTIQGPNRNFCFTYRSEPTFWFDAEEYCISRGGHLASVSGFLANEFVKDIAANICGNEFWLGGGWNTQSYNKWTWTDGLPFTYTHWFTGKFDS